MAERGSGGGWQKLAGQAPRTLVPTPTTGPAVLTSDADANQSWQTVKDAHVAVNADVAISKLASGAPGDVVVTNGAGNELVHDKLTNSNVDTAAGLTLMLAENGFVTPAPADSTITFDDGTRTLSIQPTGDNFTFWAGHLEYVSEGATKQIPDAEGLHFFYFDTAGVLQTTQTFVSAIITDYAYVAGVYWDATNNIALLLAEERHGRDMPSALHSYLHNTAHTKWQEGFGPTSVTADGSGDLDTNAQIGIEAGVMWDEDIRHSFSADALPLEAPFLYRSGAAGDWRQLASTGFVVTTAGSGRAAYNQLTGGSWQLTEVATNNFVLMHLVVVNTTTTPHFRWIVGQAEYTTLTLARQGAHAELRSIFLGSLGALRNFAHEFVTVASFIVQTAAGYGNTVKSRIRTTDEGTAYIDWRGGVMHTP